MFSCVIQAGGDVCLSAFVFTTGEQLIVTFLKIQWEETWKNRLDSIKAGGRQNAWSNRRRMN